MVNVREDIARELHKPARKIYPRRHTVIKGLHDLLQADLADFQKLSSYNKGFKYLLVVINCFSKKIYCLPLKTKTGKEVSQALDKILSTVGKIKNVQTDNGTEFYNSYCKEVFKKYGVNHYSTYGSTKASIVERAIRTLKTNIWKLFTINANHRWIDVFQNVVDTYNKSEHGTIKMTPNKASRGVFQKQVLRNIVNARASGSYTNKLKRVREFNVGDTVRISKWKTVFTKGYLPSWTTELFVINKVQQTRPRTYLLIDSQNRPIRGSFYSHELQKTSYPDTFLIEKVLQKRKNNKLLVKWLGLDKSHNSVIDAKDLV